MSAREPLSNERLAEIRRAQQRDWIDSAAWTKQRADACLSRCEHLLVEVDRLRAELADLERVLSPYLLEQRRRETRDRCQCGAICVVGYGLCASCL